MPSRHTMTEMSPSPAKPTKKGISSRRKTIVLPPGKGRDYPMGRIRAIFKADTKETGDAYSVSEWWLEPHTKGPGAHAHPEDDVFFVLEGTMSFLDDKKWIDAPKGAFVLVPGGTTHDFENRTAKRAGVLNFTLGVFEPEMKGIAAWFKQHPPGDTREGKRVSKK